MPQFVITSLGQSAASAATPTGPWVNIVEFRVGTNFDQPASVFDTDLIGGTLYSAVPSSYSLLDTDTVGIRCELPANVGPFTFGEIGLYLPGGVLFARASFGAPQQKLTGSVVGIPNAWRFTAVLRFTQAPALFNITAASQNQILEVANYSLLSAPSLMPGSPNACIVHEPNPWGESPILWKTSPNKWSIGKYNLMSVGAISEDSTTTTVKSSVFSTLGSALTRQYLIQFQNGDIRGVIGFIGDVAQLSQPTAVRLQGEAIEVYKADSPTFSAPRLSASDYNSLASLVNLTWGAPSGTIPEDIRGWGQTPIPMADVNYPPTSWPFLVDKVTRACSMLGIPNSFPLNTLQNDWSSDMASQCAQYSVLASLVRQVAGASPSDVLFSRTEQEVQTTAIRDSVYTAIHYDALVSFPSETEAKAFFNSGGWVGFRIDMDEDNMVQTLQRWRLAQLGLIRMGALMSESTGSLRIRIENGDNIIADEGICGYYGIWSSRRKLWSHMMPVGTQPGTATDTGYILFETFATQVTDTSFKFEFHITDTTGVTYSEATNTPPFRIECSCISGRPDSATLTTPIVAHPTVTTLPSSNW